MKEIHLGSSCFAPLAAHRAGEPIRFISPAGEVIFQTVAPSTGAAARGRPVGPSYEAINLPLLEEIHELVMNGKSRSKAIRQIAPRAANASVEAAEKWFNERYPAYVASLNRPGE